MRILSVDLGQARTGIAVSDFGEILASPVCTIEEKNRDLLIERIQNICAEKNISKIVVGLPRNMDGSEGESAQKARAFADELQNHTGLPIVMLDERGTTITAHKYLNTTDTRGKKRKSVVDTVAATIILQNYLDAQKKEM